jgi:hypothetical protein
MKGMVIVFPKSSAPVKDGEEEHSGAVNYLYVASYEPRPGQVRDLNEEHWRGNSKCHEQREQ